jgi:3-oxoacyl-[acyl-carrier-protein] synthase II
MNLKRVVVTGMGALTPIGNNVEAYKQGLFTGVSGAGPITRFDAAKFKTRFACEVKNFDPLNHFDRKEVRRLDPFVHFALVVAEEAVKDSNMDLTKVNLDKIGVIWGSGIGGLTTFQEEVIGFAKGDGTPRFNPFFIPKMIIDLSAGHISIKFGLRGMSYSTVSACASSTNAIVDAFNYIRLGKAHAIIAGGSEAAITEAGMGGFSAVQALSQRNEHPETASRPFDKERDGFVLGEGAGCIFLEEYEHAKARGAKIYAELIGGGMTSDAHHITAPHPQGLGARNVMLDALDDAGITPDLIDYVNVHGTSTPLGDKAEVKAIQEVFGEHAYALNISSTKSMTGHLLGAAGAIEAVAGILAIQHQMVPPTINHFTDDEDFDTKLNLTFNQAQQRSIKYVLSNTFGFGGHNCSVIFKKYED